MRDDDDDKNDARCCFFLKSFFFGSKERGGGGGGGPFFSEVEKKGKIERFSSYNTTKHHTCDQKTVTVDTMSTVCVFFRW